MSKSRQVVSVGPFVGWLQSSLPKCVCPGKQHYSTTGMSRVQRDFVLKFYGYKSYRAYIESELWATIRARVMREMKCCCGCGARPTQVHHRTYSEANLLGHDLHGLVGLNGGCHHDIEFSDERKTSLGQANGALRKKQFDNAAQYAPPTPDEIRLFLSGNHRNMRIERKLAVKRYLKLSAASGSK